MKLSVIYKCRKILQNFVKIPHVTRKAHQDAEEIFLKIYKFAIIPWEFFRKNRFDFSEVTSLFF